MSDNLLTVSAKRLGWLAQPDFCERCFFIKNHLKWKQPWPMGMPIYGSLDRAQMAFITRIIMETGSGPKWIEGLGEVMGTIEPPHFTKFHYINEEHQVKVRGQADLILKMADGSLTIVDLKTARPKGDDDPLAPTYKVQQTVYAMAAQQRGLGEVKQVALLYMSVQSRADIDFTPQCRPNWTDGCAVRSHTAST